MDEIWRCPKLRKQTREKYSQYYGQKQNHKKNMSNF